MIGALQALDWAREEMIVTAENRGDGNLQEKKVRGYFQHFGSFNPILLSGLRRTISFPLSIFSAELRRPLGRLGRLRDVRESSYSYTRLYSYMFPFSTRLQSTIFSTMRAEADVEAPHNLLGKTASGKAVGTSDDIDLLLPPTVDRMGMGSHW